MGFSFGRSKTSEELNKDVGANTEAVDGYSYPDVPEVSAIKDVSFFESLVPNFKMMMVRDDLAKAEVIEKNFKDDDRFGGMFTDDFNNPMLVWNNQAYYINKPGFSKTDLMTVLGEIIKYAPATKFVNRAKTLKQTVKRGLLSYPPTEMASQTLENALAPETEKMKPKYPYSVSPPLVSGEVDIDLGDAMDVATSTAVDVGSDVLVPPVLKTAGKVAKTIAKPIVKPIEKVIGETLYPRIRESVALGIKSVDESLDESKLKEVAGDDREFVTLITEGQRTGNRDQIAEEMTLRGLQGEAGKIITVFDKQQLEQIKQGAKQLQEEFGSGQINPLSDDILAETATDIAKTVQEGLETTKKQGTESFDIAFGKKPFKQAKFSNVLMTNQGAKNMADELLTFIKKSADGDPDYNVLKNVEKELERIQSSGKIFDNDKNSLETIARFERYLKRKFNVAFNKNPDEARMIGQVKDKLNDFIRTNVKKGVIEGDEVFLNELKNAKDLFYSAFQLEGKGFAKKGTARANANKILQSLTDSELNNRQAVNLLFGASKFVPTSGLASAIKVLQRNLPEKEKQVVMALLKDGLLEKAFTNNKTGEITRKAIVGQYRDIFIRNKDFAELLFSQKELKKINKFYREVVPTLSAELNINPSGSGFLILNSLARLGIFNYGATIPILSEASKGAARLSEQDKAIEAIRGYISRGNQPLLSSTTSAIIREDLLPDRVDGDDPNIKEAEDVEVKPQSRLITPQQEIGDVNVTSPNINITPPMTQEQPVQAASLPTSPSEGITSLNKGEQFEGLFPTDNLGRMIANRRS